MPSLFMNIAKFIIKKKKWWLIPLIITILVAAALIIFAQTSPVSPFIYMMF
jgi:hypothetical protein